MFIYLLWCHGEDGPEDLKATLDRERLVAIAETYEDSAFAIEILNAFLLKSDDVLLSESSDGIHSLERGWGGLHLQVVKAL